ncbi:hypothetical protein EYF80_029147 [Liparis tanakae]|uniref:Uncharacterized protein n=1 Tax=Liparis tanakae TaxID=230148 RepID=A0A4Z2H773_9TELE|nr:hypothetical protein EYF80_029147 [Liparis tanakae]
MKSIKAVGVQVVPDTIAAPSFSSAGVRRVAFCVGPADPQDETVVHVALRVQAGLDKDNTHIASSPQDQHHDI